MKTKWILSLVFLSLVGLESSYSQDMISEKRKAALESQSSCKNFVRFDDQNMYLGVDNINVVSLTNPAENMTIALTYPAIDAVSFSHTLYILTAGGLIAWDLEAQQMIASYPTHTLTRNLIPKEYPSGMTLSHGKLYIAHGLLGLSVFDLVQNKVIKMVPLATSQYPLESLASAITSQGHDVFVVMDSHTTVGPNEKPAFRGLVIYNPMEEKVMAEMPGLDPGADAATSDAKFLAISYNGMPFWKYDRQKMVVAAKMPTPLSRFVVYKEKGHVTGKASMDAFYYYTCYSKAADTGSHQLVPRAMKRSDLGL